MGIVSKQASISSIVAFIGIALGYFNLLYLMPKALTADQIGLYRVVVDIALVFLPFAQVGAVQSLVKFYPKYKNEKGFFNLILSLSLIGFLLFLVLFMIFKKSLVGFFETNSPEINQHYSLILGLLFINIVLAVLEAQSKATLDIVTPNFSRDIITRVLSTIYLTLYLFNFISFSTLLYGLLVITSASALLIFFILYKNHKIAFSLNFSFISKNELKKLTTYSIYSLLGSGGMLIIGKIDSIMVTSMLGLYENGIYIIAFYIATVVDIPKRHILQITTPIISNSFSNNSLNEIEDIYNKSSLNLLIISSFIFLGILINLNNIYALMPNNEIYSAGQLVVLIIGIGKLIDVAAGPNGVIISMSNHFRWNLIFVVLLAIATIGLNYIFIPIYGIIGAALASAITFLLFNLFKLIFIQIAYKMHPFNIKWLFIIAVGMGSYVITNLIPQANHTILDIMYRSTAVTILFIGPIFLTKVSPEFNTLIKTLVGKLTNGIKK